MAPRGPDSWAIKVRVGADGVNQVREGSVDVLLRARSLLDRDHRQEPADSLSILLRLGTVVLGLNFLRVARLDDVGRGSTLH